MKRADMVRFGAEQLFVTENAVDTALAEAGALASSLSKMRVDNRISAVLGQDAVDEVAVAIKALSKARGAVVRAHGHLDKVKTSLGCAEVTLNGPGEGKPPPSGHPVTMTGLSTEAAA